MKYMQEQLDIAVSLLRLISTNQHNLAGPSSTMSPVTLQNIEIRDADYRSLDV